MNRTHWLVLSVALQGLVLLGTAVSYYAVDLWGTEIRLKTKPVDPRDWLYGDYVSLNYEISDVPADRWTGRKLPDDHLPVYALLTSRDGHWTVKSVHPKPPEPEGDHSVVLKARITTSWQIPSETHHQRKIIHLRYGLEQYYVPEGTGKELEGSQKPLTVRVKVAPWGQAKITGIEK